MILLNNLLRAGFDFEYRTTLCNAIGDSCYDCWHIFNPTICHLGGSLQDHDIIMDGINCRPRFKHTHGNIRFEYLPDYLVLEVDYLYWPEEYALCGMNPRMEIRRRKHSSKEVKFMAENRDHYHINWISIVGLLPNNNALSEQWGIPMVDLEDD